MKTWYEQVGNKWIFCYELDIKEDLVMPATVTAFTGKSEKEVMDMYKGEKK